MQSVLHLFHISTLATWLSVAGLGAVAVVSPQWEQALPELLVLEEPQSQVTDFEIGEGPAGTGGADFPATPTADISELSPVETLPAPPQIQPLAELSPLPEIPELPPAAAKPAAISARSDNPVRATTQGSSSNKVGSLKSGGTTGQTGNGTASGNSMSDTARLAAGRMPAPVYPAESRRKGQSGTVIVEFTIDANGRVISAHAKTPTPWPLLNNEAVRTVRRWKYPPGSVITVRRPIVFQLR